MATTPKSKATELAEEREPARDGGSLEYLRIKRVRNPHPHWEVETHHRERNGHGVEMIGDQKTTHSTYAEALAAAAERGGE